MAILEDHLRQLKEWEAQDLLTPDQQTRNEQLQALAERYRPALERLLVD